MIRLVLALLLFTSALPSQAANSPWFETEGARLRLISQPSADGKTIEAGLEVRLEKGWKTYWRSPGASGLPPQLDFGASQNVAKTHIHYPVPVTFGEGDNLTVGYNESVTFPIQIEPLFGNRPVRLALDGLIGICAVVCIPVKFDLVLNEDGKGVSTREVASSLNYARSKLAKEPSEEFRIDTVLYRRKNLEIVATVPKGSVSSTVLVEGPVSWYLTPATAKDINGTTARFQIGLPDLPSDANPLKTELKLTLISDGNAVETDMIPTRQ